MKKRYIILIVLALAVAFIINKRWTNWFGNPPEEPYTTPATHGRIIMTLGDDPYTSRNVSWIYDTILTDAKAQLVSENIMDTLLLEAKGEVVVSRSGKSAIYNTHMSNLKSDENYLYRLINNSDTSQWISFNIPQADTPLSFIVIGDVQDTDGEPTKALFKEVDKEFPDAMFWAFVGDIIERPTDAYWNLWYNSMDGITNSKPILAATGNHEYLKGLPVVLDPRWVHSFVNPKNGNEGHEGRNYYLDFNNLRFIVLDTNGLKNPFDLRKSSKWLEDVLSDTSTKWKIVMFHHPIHSIRKSRDNFMIRWGFNSILQKYGVQLVLQGHDHAYARNTIKTKSGEKTTPVYVIASSSPKCYMPDIDSDVDCLASDVMLYHNIVINADTLHFTSYTEQSEVYDELKIIDEEGNIKIEDISSEMPELLGIPERNKKKTNMKKYNKSVERRREKTGR